MISSQEWFTSTKMESTLDSWPWSMISTDRQVWRQSTDAELLPLTDKALRECWEVSRIFWKEMRKSITIFSKKLLALDFWYITNLQPIHLKYLIYFSFREELDLLTKEVDINKKVFLVLDQSRKCLFYLEIFNSMLIILAKKLLKKISIG